MPRPKSVNPFYVALLVVSIAFVLTVCGYTVLTFRGSSREVAAQPDAGHGLLDFLDQYGVQLMLAEVAVLGVATVGAIMTDQYWSKRAHRRAHQQNDPSQT